MARHTFTGLAVGIVLAVGAHAGDRGTPVEAKAMLAKAAAHYRAVGPKQALADFTGKKAPFGIVTCMSSA